MPDLHRKDASVNVYIKGVGGDETHKINVPLDRSTLDAMETRNINRRAVANALRAIARKVETT